MENKCLSGGFYPSGVNPIIHGRFRERSKARKGTLNGTYTKDLTKALVWAMDELDGKLEKVELVDQEARLLLTHTTNNVKTHIFRKNERTDLTQLGINKLPIELLNRVKHCAIDHFPKERNKLSCLTNYAMDLWVEVQDDFVKLVKTVKKPNTSFISDEKGQVNLVDNASLFEAVEYLTSTVYELKSDIKEIKKSTVQSTLNIIPKAVRKVKNVVNSTGKSVNRDVKLVKAVSVLENVMKWNEYGFTVRDYEKSLVKLTGQGDPRTVSSDLAMLESDNRVKKMRNSAHGTATYQFVDNNQYHKYNTDLAKTKFFKAFHSHFKDVDALKLDELNNLIFEKYGLFDAKSQNKYLRWLIADGCVKRHEVNPKLLFIE